MTVRNDAPIHLASRLVQVWESGASLNSCKPCRPWQQGSMQCCYVLLGSSQISCCKLGKQMRDSQGLMIVLE